MKYIKTFENYNQVNELLKADSTKIKNFIKDLVKKVKDSKLVSEIQRIVDVMQVDPYSSFEEIMDYLHFKYKGNAQVCSVILPQLGTNRQADAMSFESKKIN